MATHTPRSLLWLLANGSQGFGLIELLASMPYGDVDHEAEAILLAQVRTAWARGWQPIELHRQGYRGCTAKPAGKLIALAIAVDHASRRRDEIDPWWRAQVERLQLPTATGGDGWLTGFIAHERLERTEAMRTVVDALRNLVACCARSGLSPKPTGRAPTRCSPRSGRCWPRPSRRRSKPRRSPSPRRRRSS